MEYRFVKEDVVCKTSNLRAFCRLHNLDRRNVQRLISGERQSYNGWFIEKPNGKQQAIDNQLVEDALRQYATEDAIKRATTDAHVYTIMDALAHGRM